MLRFFLNWCLWLGGLIRFGIVWTSGFRMAGHPPRGSLEMPRWLGDRDTDDEKYENATWISSSLQLCHLTMKKQWAMACRILQNAVSKSERPVTGRLAVLAADRTGSLVADDFFETLWSFCHRGRELEVIIKGKGGGNTSSYLKTWPQLSWEQLELLEEKKAAIGQCIAIAGAHGTSFWVCGSESIWFFKDPEWWTPIPSHSRVSYGSNMGC